MEGDRVGIVAFAGRAFLQAPLTIDYESVVRTLVELEPDIIPMGGTNIAEAIRVSLEAFGKAEGNNRALVIMSDGEELADDAVDEARKAAKEILICTVGVGTPDGSLISLPRDGGYSGDFVRDERGQVVTSRLDETRLRELAKIGGGVYARLGEPGAMDPVIGALGRLEKTQKDSTTKEVRILRYQWPLAGAVLLLLTAMILPERIGERKLARATRSFATLVVLTLATGVFGTSARAETPAADPATLYAAGKYDEAYSAYMTRIQKKDQALVEFNAGCAAFKAKNYTAAAQAFANALTSKDQKLQKDAHYNLGNTLYRAGEESKKIDDKLDSWRSALQHYDGALKIKPADQAAKFNRDLVRKRIAELEQQKRQQQQQQDQQQQKQQQQKKENGDDEKQQQQGGDQKEQQKQEGGQQQGDQKEQQQGQSEGQGQDGQSSGEGDQQNQGGKGEQPDENKSGGGNEEKDEKEGESGQSQKDGNQPGAEPKREKPLEGELKGNQEGDQSGEEGQQLQEGEPGNAEMTAAEAARLLEKLGREEERVLLYEHQRREPVYKDW
jgi:Ca-activated chloride channel family protein